MIEYVGIDVETTGLNEREDDLIELGIVLLNENLMPVKSFSSVINPGDVDACVNKMNDFVYDMHMGTGLISELEDAPTLGEVEKMACDFLIDNEAINLPMVGSSITLDRNFLREHMPRFFDLIHHRSIDATSLRLAANVTGASTDDLYTWANEHAEWVFSQFDDDFVGEEHRVIYDVLKSASLIKSSIAHISNPPF